MRARRLTFVSFVAACAVALVGCSGLGNTNSASTPTPSATPRSLDTDDPLCAAKVAPGAASDAISASGTIGAVPTVTFTAPLVTTQLESTLLETGSGQQILAGDLVAYGIVAFEANTGTRQGDQGYEPGSSLPQQISAETPLGQILGCATVGSRFAVASPGTSSASGQAFVVDVLAIVPKAAWGAPQEPVAGMPKVTIGAGGDPSIEKPSGTAPDKVKLAVLKKGDGETVASGDQVMVQYRGIKWSDGSEFDSSWSRGEPAAFATTGVVKGFQQALEGQTVGSQVEVIIPPAAGYGEKSDSNKHELAGETLVFVVDILATQHAPAQ